MLPTTKESAPGYFRAPISAAMLCGALAAALFQVLHPLALKLHETFFTEMFFVGTLPVVILSFSAPAVCRRNGRLLAWAVPCAIIYQSFRATSLWWWNSTVLREQWQNDLFLSVRYSILGALIGVSLCLLYKTRHCWKSAVLSAVCASVALEFAFLFLPEFKSPEHQVWRSALTTLAFVIELVIPSIFIERALQRSALEQKEPAYAAPPRA